MEWMLQVADEIDDAVATLRLCWIGTAPEIGMVLAGSIGGLAIGAALMMGAEAQLMIAAASVLGVATALRVRGSQNARRR